MADGKRNSDIKITSIIFYVLIVIAICAVLVFGSEPFVQWLFETVNSITHKSIDSYWFFAIFIGWFIWLAAFIFFVCSIVAIVQVYKTKNCTIPLLRKIAIKILLRKRAADR